MSVIHVRTLWNQPLYKTVTDTWGRQTRMTAWQTLTPLVDAHRNGWKKLFFHLLDLSLLNSHSFLTSCGSKLTEISGLPGSGKWKGECPTTDHPTGQGRSITSTSQLTRLRHLAQWTLALRRKMSSLLCVFHENWRNVAKFNCSECSVGLYWSLLQGVPHNCIFEDSLTLHWKKRKTERKYCNFTITSCMPAILMHGHSTDAYTSYQPLLSVSLS
jgi:hypothetical protein